MYFDSNSKFMISDQTLDYGTADFTLVDPQNYVLTTQSSVGTLPLQAPNKNKVVTRFMPEEQAIAVPHAAFSSMIQGRNMFPWVCTQMFQCYFKKNNSDYTCEGASK